jgi:hypothetical protein
MLITLSGRIDAGAVALGAGRSGSSPPIFYTCATSHQRLPFGATGDVDTYQTDSARTHALGRGVRGRARRRHPTFQLPEPHTDYIFSVIRARCSASSPARDRHHLISRS